MKRLAHSLKVFWRSERLLKANELRLNIKRVQLTGVASLVAVFGLLMLNLAMFFAVAPYWGQALAALTVAVIDLALAALLMAWARQLKPPAEVEMVREVRDMALSEIEHEIDLAHAELLALRKDVRHLVRNPADALLPGLLAPLLSGAAKGLKSRRSKSKGEAP